MARVPTDSQAALRGILFEDTTIAPRKPKKHDLSPAWLAVEEAVMGHQFTGDAGVDAFQLCRIAHGLLGQHNVDPFSIAPFQAARRLHAALRDHHPDVAGVAELVETSWRSVMVPEGYDPVQWAVKRVGWLKRPQMARGKYVTPKQRRLATTIWHTFRLLPKDEHGFAFASCRKLARYVDADFKTVACLLHNLEGAGLLTRKRLESTCCADRFLVQMSY